MMSCRCLGLYVIYFPYVIDILILELSHWESQIEKKIRKGLVREYPWSDVGYGRVVVLIWGNPVHGRGNIDIDRLIRGSIMGLFQFLLLF